MATKQIFEGGCMTLGMSFGELCKTIPDRHFFFNADKKPVYTGHGENYSSMPRGYYDLTRTPQVDRALSTALGARYIVLPSNYPGVSNARALWRHYCETQHIPFITIERVKKSFTVDAESTVTRGRLTLSSITRDDILKIYGSMASRFAAFDESAYHMTLPKVRKFEDAQTLARLLVKAFEDSSLHQNKENPMVKFFKDGKALAVQTDASSESEFTRDFAFALQDYLTGSSFEGQHELETFLKNYAEVCCKMRGYKSEVREQRLLTAGEINPASETCVNITEHGTQILKAVA